jgi:hypothetical protein
MASQALRVKIFTAYHDVAAIEQDINDWLAQNAGIKIERVLQSESWHDQRWNLLITFLYLPAQNVQRSSSGDSAV